MKHLYIAAYLAVIPVAVWVGLTAVDAQLRTVTVLGKTLFFVPVADPGLKAALDHWSHWRFIDVLVLPVPFLVVFGGLPISLLAAMFDPMRRQSAKHRSLAFAHYSVFILQLVSTVLSGVWLALTMIFWREWFWDAWDTQAVLFFLYFTIQFGAGVWTLPAWRRAFEHASLMRRDAYSIRVSA